MLKQQSNVKNQANNFNVHIKKQECIKPVYVPLIENRPANL